MNPHTPALNVFPARVEGAAFDRELRGVRVFVANDRAMVFESPNAPSVTVADVVAVEGTPSKSRATTIRFADGTEWKVFRAGGCGCGDPLKRFSVRKWM